MTLVVIIGAVFYFAVDPATFPFMPQCVFHRLTGLQCVGCGSQRMLHALLHGDIAGDSGQMLLSLSPCHSSPSFCGWNSTGNADRIFTGGYIPRY